MRGGASLAKPNRTNKVIELGPGDACIVRKGEWHRVMIVEPPQLIHITLGPHGDYRSL
jgi:quercetin dioxygenase-like cupin family protein